MSSRSSSPSILSDNDSDLSSSLSEDVPEIIEGEFIPYDEIRKSVFSSQQHFKSFFETQWLLLQLSAVLSCKRGLWVVFHIDP